GSAGGKPGGQDGGEQEEGEGAASGTHQETMSAGMRRFPDGRRARLLEAVAQAENARTNPCQEAAGRMGDQQVGDTWRTAIARRRRGEAYGCCDTVKSAARCWRSATSCGGFCAVVLRFASSIP